MLPSASFRYERQWRNPVIIPRKVPRLFAATRHLRVTLLCLLSVGRFLRLWERRAAQSLHHRHHHRHSHRNHLHHLLRPLPGLQLPRQVSAPRRPQLRPVACAANGRCVVVPRLMMCKTVEDNPQVTHSVVQEASSSSQGGSALSGSARREMEVNGSIAGKKAADSNELERLFTQHDLQDATIVS